MTNQIPCIDISKKMSQEQNFIYLCPEREHRADEI